MPYLFFLFLAIIAGLLIPLQASLNAQLGNAVKSPAYGALLSFVVGIAGLLVYCLVARVDFQQLRGGFQQPWYTWTGGLMGAFFVLTLIVAPPRLGMALTLGVTVAAQLIFGLVMDHYGWLGLEKISINLPKLLGAALIIGGVYLLRS